MAVSNPAGQIHAMSPYDPSGVDVTLIRWFLSLTPAERVEWIEESIDTLREIWRLNGIEPYADAAEDAFGP